MGGLNMSLLKIGGKTKSNTASAFLLGDDGAAVVSRPWRTTVTTIVDAIEVRDNVAHTVTDNNALEIGIYPINSLRIRNTLDSNVTLTFYYDLDKTSTTYLDGLGETYTYTLEAGNTHWQLITSENLPLLDYAKYLKFKYQASEVPTTGSLNIQHCGKG